MGNLIVRTQIFDHAVKTVVVFIIANKINVTL